MASVLLAWIGKADVKAAKLDTATNLGPIGQAVMDDKRTFDHVVLLNDIPVQESGGYDAWLKKKTKASVVVRDFVLPSPTHYESIYRAVTTAIAWTHEKYGQNAALTFHLSPGTSAMTAIWIIVAKTQVRAELIHSSPEDGVRTAVVPFQLSAEFIPDAVAQTSQDLARLVDGTRPDEPKFGSILHKSEVMKHLVRRARQAAPFKEAIFIEGESGTGKQLLALAIHTESPRKNKPFEEVNCGAIPKDLFESTFFGHTRGAFTGAEREKKGCFELAHGGTLFLDEVGELSLEHQVKLLRALQEKKVRPVGAAADIVVDVRVIAATNRNVLEEVRAGRFREDLYYRLAVLVLKVPPLRERKGDLGYLIDKLLENINAELADRPGAVHKKLSVGGRNLLLRHAWPGNVRELDATLRRACVWSTGATLDEADLRDALMAPPRAVYVDVLGRPLGDGFNLEDVLHEVGHHYLSRAMKDAEGTLAEATKLVGLANYQTLKSWLEKYGVER